MKPHRGLEGRGPSFYIIGVGALGLLAACLYPIYEEAFVWPRAEWTWDTLSLPPRDAFWGKLAELLPLSLPWPAALLGAGVARRRKRLMAYAGGALVLLWSVRRVAGLAYASAKGHDVDVVGWLIAAPSLWDPWHHTVPGIVVAMSSGMLLSLYLRRGPRLPQRVSPERVILSVCCSLLATHWLWMAWHTGSIGGDLARLSEEPAPAELVGRVWLMWPPLLAAIGYLGVDRQYRGWVPWLTVGLTAAVVIASAATSFIFFGHYLGMPGPGDFSPTYVSLCLLAGPLAWPTASSPWHRLSEE